MRKLMIVFLTGLAQVLLVSVNAYFILKTA
jgi:hypothetical protein